MRQQTILAPSILAGDHAALADSVRLVEVAAAPWLHLDIMDGHFVPNLTFGPQTCRALRSQCALFIDTHLMLSRPQDFVEPFAKAGSDQIIVHVEADHDIGQTLARIHRLDCRAGLALNPDTPADRVFPFLDSVDLVLAMTVFPGFGGQSFHEEVLETIARIHAERERLGLAFRLEVDGGIDKGSGRLCWQAGADTFVAGTAFFKAEDPVAFHRAFEAFAQESH